SRVHAKEIGRNDIGKAIRSRIESWRGRIAEAREHPVDLDAVPCGLNVEAAKEGGRSDFSADAPVHRLLRTKHFARRVYQIAPARDLRRPGTAIERQAPGNRR